MIYEKSSINLNIRYQLLASAPRTVDQRGAKVKFTHSLVAFLRFCG